MKQRIVFDTNCLIVIVPKGSQYRWIFEKIISGEIEMVITTEILLEYEVQLGKFYSPEYGKAIVKVLVNLPCVLKVNPISFNLATYK